jgi:hypothetical protein
MHDDIASRAISDDFTFGKDDASISNGSNNFNIMSSDDDGMSVGSELRENFNQSLFGSVIESTSGFIEQQQWRFRGQHD